MKQQNNSLTGGLLKIACFDTLPHINSEIMPDPMLATLMLASTKSKKQ